MKNLSGLAIIFLLSGLSAWAQSAPTGNDSQGGVAVPAGKYEGIPASGPVPANAYTANATRVVDDLNVTAIGEIPLSWVRYTSTRPTSGSSPLAPGASWRHSYQWDFAATTANGVAALQVIYPDGTTNLFYQTSPSIWTSTSAVTDVITPTGNGYILTNAANQVYTFVTAGSVYQLSKITDSRGLITNLAYGANGLSTITEPGGRYLTISYVQTAIMMTTPNTGGGPKVVTSGMSPQVSGSNTYYAYYISKVTSSDGRYVSYSYNGTTTFSSNATQNISTFHNYISSASYSDSTSAAYSYTPAGNPISYTNLITQANDVRAKGVPNIGYTYFGGGTDPIGSVSTTKEASTSTTISTVSLKNSNTQAPSVTYPDNSVYNYSVNAGGLQASVTNTLNASNSYAYTSGTGTWTTTATDANGNSVAKTKSTNGKLTVRTWPKVGTEAIAPSEHWYYNSAGYLTSYVDTLNHTTTFTRAVGTNLISSISYPDNTSESYTYNGFNQPLTHTRRNGGVEHFTYDPTGLLLTEQDAVGNTTTFTYDAHYRVASIKDASNHTTSFLYNDAGKVTQITHPDATYQTFTYDSTNNLLTKTDELNHTWTYTYDKFDRVVTSKDPISRTTTYTYSVIMPNNRSPKQITLPSGKQTSITYVENWGYKPLVKTIGNGTSNAVTTTYAYDSAGNLTSVADGLNRTSTFGYDARERKAWAKDPAGNEAMYYYDDASNLIDQITPDGTTASAYDTMNRPSQVNDAKNQITKFTYDAEGCLKTYTDPKSNIYTYGYDLDARRLATQYPDTTTIGVTYDPAGNVVTSYTRDNKLKTLSYDNRNRNTGYSWNDGITPSVTIGYDAASRVTSLSNSNSALSYVFDNANETSSETQNITGLGSKTVSYTYTVDGLLNGMTYPDTTALTYGYDNDNNVTSIQQGGSNVVTYTYDANNNRVGKNLANGVNSTLTYDNVERLTSITDLTPSPSAGTLLEKFQYGYDALSRRTYVKRDNALGDVYGYDTADQLTSVQYNCTNPDTTPSAPSRTVNYTYDAAGNRTQVQDSVNGTTSYTPNNNNQYTTAASSPATYDGRGNLATFAGTTYSYDANNLLLQATSGLGTTVFAYDPLGRCVKQVAAGVTSYFIYDTAWNTLADFNSSGTQTERYVHGPATDEMVTKTDNTNAVVYYHTDGLGSVMKLTSSTGALLEQYAYDVYGLPTIKNAVGAVLMATAYANRFLFTGREYLASLNLYNYRSRVYSPEIGRFLQTDPISFSGDAYNIYRYCANNPVNNIDPSGEGFWGVVGNSLTGAGAGALTGAFTGGVIGLCVGGLPGMIAGATGGAFVGALAGSIAGGVGGSMKSGGDYSFSDSAFSGGVAGAAGGIPGGVAGLAAEGVIEASALDYALLGGSSSTLAQEAMDPSSSPEVLGFAFALGAGSSFLGALLDGGNEFDGQTWNAVSALSSEVITDWASQISSPTFGSNDWGQSFDSGASYAGNDYNDSGYNNDTPPVDTYNDSMFIGYTYTEDIDLTTSFEEDPSSLSNFGLGMADGSKSDLQNMFHKTLR